MTVNDLIRELSELSPIDRTLTVTGVEYVNIYPGRYVDLGAAFTLAMCPDCGETWDDD